MITEEQAEAIALAVINEPDPHWPDRPPLVLTKTEPHRLGWLFYYQSSEHLRTGEFSSVLAGNGPLLVAALDGSHARVGTAAPLEERIVEAARKLEGRS
jgi:hypothetical protein